MATFPIVKHFDVVKDIGTRLLPSYIDIDKPEQQLYNNRQLATYLEMREMKQYDNARLIVQLGNSIVQNRNTAAAKFGLTSGQALIMKFLLKRRDSGEINQLDIQKDMNLSHQTVTGMLRRLERDGYVIREQSPRDKRYKRITMAQEAKELEQALKEVAHCAEEKVIEGMTEAEQVEFNRLLRIAHKNMTGVTNAGELKRSMSK
jgi:MarR family multiple gene transcriptional regulator MgrA